MGLNQNARGLLCGKEASVMGLVSLNSGVFAPGGYVAMSGDTFFARVWEDTSGS